MKNQILIGTADARGEGKIIFGLGPQIEPLELMQVLEKAKRRHQFPEGVKHLRLCTLTVVDSATFIDAGLSETFAAQDAAAEAQRKLDEENGRKLAAALSAIKDAEALVASTAKTRNDLQGQLLQVNTKLNNLNVTPETLRGASYKGNVKALSEQQTKLQEDIAKAIAAYDEAAKALHDLKNPKPAPSGEAPSETKENPPT